MGLTNMGSGLLLRLLELGFSTMMVDVFQVFSSYETIQTCWDRRRTDMRVGTLGWSPQLHLSFQECFVVGLDIFSAIVVKVVYISVGVVAVLLGDSFN